MSDGLHVDSNLVCPACLQFDPEQREARQGAHDVEVRTSLTREVAADGHPRADAGVASDRGLDRASTRRGTPDDEGEVFAFDASRGERCLQECVGLIGARYDEQTGGVTIEPVNDPGSIWILPTLGAGGRPGEELCERALAMPASWMDDDTGGLVDDE